MHSLLAMLLHSALSIVRWSGLGYFSELRHSHDNGESRKCVGHLQTQRPRPLEHKRQVGLRQSVIKEYTNLGSQQEPR